MAKIIPYLNFDGKTEEAFNFYKSILGGEFTAVMKMSDAPESENFPEEEKDRIMHISLAIDEDNILMASDTMPSFGHTVTTGNNVQISMHPGSREETERLFNGLSEGGKIEMALEDTFWGAYFGSFVDKFGVSWMLNFDENFAK